MKTCFISRLGGAGDVLHAAHLPRLIKEYYKVDKIDFETNYFGMHILTNNPFIDNLIFLDANKITQNRMAKNLQDCRERYDMVFDFVNTIELEYCCNENDQRYYRSDKWRRKKLGKKSYYDVMTDAAGLPESYYGTRGQLYYSNEDHDMAYEWAHGLMAKHDATHIIMVNLSGSTLHKKFVQAESICRKILDKYPKALILLTGDEHCLSQVFQHERVISWVGKKGFRTAALMTKYVNLNISLESGLALVAHSWNAPTLQLLTAASWDNHVKYAQNAYWLQSPASCSPCHRNPREYFGCPVREKHPSCIWFDEDQVMQKVEEAIGC